MPRKAVKKEKEQPKSLKTLAMAIAVIGILLLLVTIVTWQPSDLSHLVTRLNLLTLSLSILYILFGYILLKAKF